MVTFDFKKIKTYMYTEIGTIIEKISMAPGEKQGDEVL